MNISLRQGRPIAGEQGMAMVSALLLLLIVSLMAVGVSMDTSMDVRLAAYQRFKARSLGFAESGIMAATDILEENIFAIGWPNPSSPNPFSFPNLSPNYVGTINILMTTDSLGANNVDQNGSFYMDNNPKENPTLEMTGDINASIIIQLVGSQLSRGNALQMAKGYSGKGKGAGGGGTNVIYNIMSQGTDADNSRSDLGLYFRHVTN